MKRWQVILLTGPPPKKLEVYIELGDKSDKGDVKEAINRQGLGGEILGINDVSGYSKSDIASKKALYPKKYGGYSGGDDGTASGSGSIAALVIMAGVLVALFLVLRRPATNTTASRPRTVEEITAALNNGQISLSEANSLIGGL